MPPCLRATLAVATLLVVPADASADTPTPAAPLAPLASPPGDDADRGPLVQRVERRLISVSGRSVSVRATARGARALRVSLRLGERGRLLETKQVDPGERFTIRTSAKPGHRIWMRVVDAGDPAIRQDEPIGRVRQWRSAVASWYGPGLYGNRTACGQRLTPSLEGVAHKHLACGTRVTITYRGRTTHARVVDRGPFHAGREFDLTAATANAVGFRAVARIRVAR